MYVCLKFFLLSAKNIMLDDIPRNGRKRKNPIESGTMEERNLNFLEENRIEAENGIESTE